MNACTASMSMRVAVVVELEPARQLAAHAQPSSARAEALERVVDLRVRRPSAAAAGAASSAPSRSSPAAARAAPSRITSGADDVELAREHQPAPAHGDHVRQTLAARRQLRRRALAAPPAAGAGPRSAPAPPAPRRRSPGRPRRSSRDRPAASTSAKRSPVTSAPIGRPPPSALATVIASGTTPVCSIRPQRARAPHPALDLVEDQRRPMLVAGLARRAQQLVGEHVHAALALDRLQHHRRRLVVDRRGEIAAAVGSTARKPGTSGANGACLASCGVAESEP